MKLHLVGGFLGSGKTTAIIAASRELMRRGLRVGVVTNDQGKYLVDTAFFQLADLPTVEVTGGCFCCNYGDLDSSLDQLFEKVNPDVVFAESVGSCADLIATVVKPLLQLKAAEAAPTSFTVFTDGRLLRRRLLDQPMPFSDDVMYIFDMQIEEAGLVVINKADLLTPAALDETRQLFHHRYDGKTSLVQNSLAENGVDAWLDLLETDHDLPAQTSIDIDYARYGRGEAQLAWLDEEVTLSASQGKVGDAVRGVIRSVLDKIKARGAGVGHIKFILTVDDIVVKLSFPTLDEPGWEQRVPDGSGGQAHLLVNARVEMNAQELSRLFHSALDEGGVDYVEDRVDYFHPRQPNPTHRIA